MHFSHAMDVGKHSSDQLPSYVCASQPGDATAPDSTIPHFHTNHLCFHTKLVPKTGVMTDPSIIDATHFE
jgi:hypothetical protein